MEPASSNELLKDYGKHVFTGAVADEFLSKHGGSGAILDDPSWVEDRSLADLVAAAVLDWYVLMNRPRPPPSILCLLDAIKWSSRFLPCGYNSSSLGAIAVPAFFLQPSHFLF